MRIIQLIKTMIIRKWELSNDFKKSRIIQLIKQWL